MSILRLVIDFFEDKYCASSGNIVIGSNEAVKVIKKYLIKAEILK